MRGLRHSNNIIFNVYSFIVKQLKHQTIASKSLSINYIMSVEVHLKNHQLLATKNQQLINNISTPIAATTNANEEDEIDQLIIIVSLIIVSIELILLENS